MHPRDVLLGAQAGAVSLPVCDHYSGVEQRMRKSLQLQAEMIAEFGTCVFDASLDCEDGAPVGGEMDHAQLVAGLAQEAYHQASTKKLPASPRVAVRLHPVDHPCFDLDVDTVVSAAARELCHLMIPKVESVADIEKAVKAVDAAAKKAGRLEPLPIQVLLESPAAVHRAFDIAAHPRVQSISFGLMDFVSAHAGAIPDSAMSSRLDGSEPGQFSHPHVVRAKLEIAAACHAHGKVPSHCVVTEFNDHQAISLAAKKAGRELGFTRMWSIHPNQIRPILEALAPSAADIERAAALTEAAQAAQWAPVSFEGQLHDRASYRYFWQVLERAHQTGRELPNSVKAFF